jgi:hypothetical protein
VGGKPIRTTNANLLRYGLEPAMRRLIATALDGATATYGELKRHLELEAGFSPIFPTKVGFVVGSMMSEVQKHVPSAPLLNVLAVNQLSRLPSEGAGWYMANRFGNTRLGSKSYKERYPARWKEYFEKAAAEVYAYSEQDWTTVYYKTFGQPLSLADVTNERQKRQAGIEDDYGSGPGKYGLGGEGEHHKNLRLWVLDHPKLIDRAYGSARSETEFPLDSGDRVDVVYHLPDRTVVLEAKSRVSNELDYRRGVFQCIKYRAVKQAMDVRAQVPIEAILVTEDKVPGEIAALLRRHGIRHCLVPQVRPK